MALSPKHAAFVREYLIDLNATQAAIRAGYSARTAKQQGSRLLTHVDVKAAIDAAKRQTEERGLVTREEVIEGLKKEARGAESDTARVSAWGLLAKHLGMLSEKHEFTGKYGEALTIRVVSYEKDDG